MHSEVNRPYEVHHYVQCMHTNEINKNKFMYICVYAYSICIYNFVLT